MRRHPCKLPLGIGVAIITLRLTFHIYSFNDKIVIHEKEDRTFPTIVPEAYPSISEQPHHACKENSSVKSFPDFDKQPQNMKDFLTYRHCKSFPQLLDSPMKCGGPSNSQTIFLLLAIKSSPANYERRETVRKTWGTEKSYEGFHVKRVFLSGIPTPQKESKRIMQLLSIEQKMYNDILLWNFYDTFYNLTLKQVLFHTWMNSRCPGVQFIYNGDDDVFVNTFNVITYLQGLGKFGSKQHLFVGALNIGMPPVRESNSKYYVPEALFPGKEFVPYCGGGGIIMSSFTGHSIYGASQNIPLFPIDDAYLGMCLERAGLKPDNHEGIKTYGINLPSVDSFDPCFYRDLLMVHRFVPYEMIVMWKALQLTKLQCSSNSKV